MAEMIVADKGGKGGKPKPKKHTTRVDLTPMVDLGFLLITFFMLTTSLLKPQTMELTVPSKDDVADADANKVKASQAITILLGKNDQVYYFFGAAENGVDPELIKSNYSSDEKGLRKMLMTKNAEVMNNVNQLRIDKANRKVNEEQFKAKLSEFKSAKSAPTVMIKATDESNYKNLVDVLDEMNICNYSRYAIVDITPDDIALIGRKFPQDK